MEHAHGRPVGVEHVCAAVMSADRGGRRRRHGDLDATPRETIYASDQVAADLEELTLTLGEGPGVDAFAGGPALVADLTASDCLARWPMFAPAATQAGVRAVFALPLQVGAIRLGVLDLYRAQPGDLDREQLADALVLADTACALLLDAAQRDRVTPGRTRARAGRPAPSRGAPGHRNDHRAAGGDRGGGPRSGCAPTRTPTTGGCVTSPPTWSPDACDSTATPTAAATRDGG